MAPPRPAETLEAVRRLRGRFADGEGVAELSDGAIGGFLWQSRGHEDKAADLLRQHLSWRRENLPVQRSEVAEVLQAGGMAVLDGTSTAGHPVWLLNFKRLLQVDFDRKGEMDLHVRGGVYCAEEMISRMPASVSQWVAIINCTGITMPPRAFMNALAETFKPNYPERCIKIVLYPIPRWLVRALEAGMQWVPANTREKMSFVTSLDDVCEVVGLAREQLPERLLDPKPPRVLDQKPPRVLGGPAAPEASSGDEAVIEVAASQRSLHRRAVSSGARVEWEVRVLEHTVALGLRFLPSDGEPLEILCPARVTRTGGAFAPERDGVMEFSLDNTFSYLTGKSVAVAVRCVDAREPASAERAAAAKADAGRAGGDGRAHPAVEAGCAEKKGEGRARPRGPPALAVAAVAAAAAAGDGRAHPAAEAGCAQKKGEGRARPRGPPALATAAVAAAAAAADAERAGGDGRAPAAAGGGRAEKGDGGRWAHWPSWARLCTSRSAVAVLA